MKKLNKTRATPWQAAGTGHLAMIGKTMAAVVVYASFAAIPAVAAEPDNCKSVRFSDVGWTDITATTALTSVVLNAIGYEPETQLLSVPVTYTSLKNGDIDVFLGNWMPTMEADILLPIAKRGLSTWCGPTWKGPSIPLP